MKMRISDICRKKTGIWSLPNSWQLSFRKNCFPAVIAAILLSFSVVPVVLASGGESKPVGWVATDTYRVMNFTVLAVALFFVLRKPVSRALDDRIRGIREQLGELEARKKDAESDLGKHSENLLCLEQEAAKIVEEYVRQGNDARKRILGEAEAAAQKLEEQASRNIEQEFKRAKTQLQADIIEKALAKAEDVIKSKITPGDQDRLVDEYLEKVVA